MTIDTNDDTFTIIPLAERGKVTDEWLYNRLETLLPVLMNKHGIDSWITIGREYHEDPAAITLFPSSIDSSRRLTIFVFLRERNTNRIKRFVISSNKQFEPFYMCYSVRKGEEPFDVLRRIMDTYNPEKIAINYSSHFSFCDGLSHSLYQSLTSFLGNEHSAKLISSEPLALDWMQLRTDSELHSYKELATITRNIVKQALSNDVIIPRITTTRDVVDWVRQKVLDLGIKTSFYPTVDIQRKDSSADRIEGVILHGDIVHLDFGIEYLGLCTDTQQLAYVLHPYEQEIPDGLKMALRVANHFEDIFSQTIRTGITGNELFEEVLNKAAKNEIQAMLYSHPIGYHCHAAGPIIGLYDKQEPIPIRGELPIQNNTCYALEFNIRSFIPEWNKDIPVYLEESVCVKDKMSYLTKRQTEFYVISSNTL